MKAHTSEPRVLDPFEKVWQIYDGKELLDVTMVSDAMRRANGYVWTGLSKLAYFISEECQDEEKSM
jgi:hypothetical protein